MAVDTDGGPGMLTDLDDELWADAWDAYFPAPLSLSLVANTFAHNGMQRELGLLLDLHDGQVDELVADLRQLLQTGRPDVTAIAHHSVPGQAAMHLHVHVYVARTAPDQSTGERVPVERPLLAAAAAGAWHRYSGRLREQTTDALGFGWDPLPDDPGGASDGTDEVRVVGLPRAVHVSGPEYCVCHGYLGPHEQIMAQDHVVNVDDAVRPASG
jgi:hypothetical protein